MNIIHLRHKEIDIEKYDYCIENSPFGKVYAMSWYLDAVSPGWEILMAEDYKYVMPLPVKKKFGVKYITQPVFCQQLGIFSVNQLSIDIFKIFVQKIPCVFFYLQLNHNNIFKYPNMSFRDNFVLDLNKPYAQIRACYKTNCLRNIKKSEKEQLTCIISSDKKEFLNMVCENHEKTLIKNMKNTLEKMINNPSFNWEIWNVKDEKQHILSATAFLKWKNKLYYSIPVSTIEGKNKLGMFFLLDQFIQKHAAKDIILDFEGSSIPNIARLYKGFGGQNQSYPAITKQNNYSRFFSLIKKIR